MSGEEICDTCGCITVCAGCERLREALAHAVDSEVRALNERREVEAEVARLHAELASSRTVERKDLHEQIERLRAALQGLLVALGRGGSNADAFYDEVNECIAAARAALSQPAATGEGACPDCGHTAHHHQWSIDGWSCSAPECRCTRKHTATKGKP